MRLRYLELFAGAGGLSMGLDAAGWSCVAHAEIEPHARAVLRRAWPGVPLLGDVREVRGADWPCELVSGGSPCQDLSVAGKRAGLGGARSGLFHEQVRVWNETGAPHILWENVCGALSSNAGRDFAVVLGAIVGATVPVPADGWGSAGVVAGPTGVAAWRVLDLQWFGPPQRRRRVFVLGARAGGVDPAEVLLEPESLCRHPAPRRSAGEGAAGGAGDGAATARGVVAWDGEMNGVGTVMGAERTHHSAHNRPGVVAFDTTQVTSPLNYSNPRAGDTDHPLAAGAHAPVLVFDWQNSPSQGMACRSESDDSLRTSAVPAVLALDTYNHDVSQRVFHTLRTGGMGDAAPGVLCATGHVTHALTHEGHDAGEDGTGRGTPIVLGALTARIGKGADSDAGGIIAPGVLPTLTVNGDAHSGYRDADGLAVGVHGVPRRLMPLECERLMSWPDLHTEYGVREDGARYRLSDAARYKLCGNGVGSKCAEWIGHRLATAIETQRPTGGTDGAFPNSHTDNDLPRATGRD